MAIDYSVPIFTDRVKLAARSARHAVQVAEQQLFNLSLGDLEHDLDLVSEEDAKINVNKTFKYRRLKTDPASKLARKLYRLRSMNPEFRRKKELYRKKYELKNKRDLERRAEVVKKMKARLPDPPKQPRTENHRRSPT